MIISAEERGIPERADFVYIQLVPDESVLMRLHFMTTSSDQLVQHLFRLEVSQSLNVGLDL